MLKVQAVVVVSVDLTSIAIFLIRYSIVHLVEKKQCFNAMFDKFHIGNIFNNIQMRNAGARRALSQLPLPPPELTQHLILCIFGAASDSPGAGVLIQLLRKR